MQTVIKVENLSKRYQIDRFYQGKGTLRDVIIDTIKSPFGNKKNKFSEEIWAIRDVSFEVKKGDTIGIIGGNGVGKSTLLKILSRIIKPTSGRVIIKGRVGSLLEIGTGFHPDLTGRENIFLNGAILGMGRKEIEKKFEEIVDFSGIERFLDTSVKYYSSGMYAKLAFAVAAHLESEILLVDEVLAVGDAPFQAKCLDKMRNIAESGKTILLVSHDSEALLKLCKTGLYLNNGETKAIGQIKNVMKQYMADYGQITGVNGMEPAIKPL